MSIKLKDIYLFEGIDSDFINLIVDNSRRLEINSGEYIIRQGENSDDSAYIIQDGNAIVEIDGKEVKELTEGNIFGEIALITDEPRTASIKAKSSVVLLKINKELLHKIMKEFKNGREIQKIVFERIMENHKKK
ncbi:MAG: cyclic nucleotide-binding domain-containing protein [Candidatus Gracilibacteria bacterium]|nr:cyclic nucleotide-binding domain-containing protein [Candidatus Gracilibacteria bacterium]